MTRLAPPGTHGRPLIVVDARRMLPRCVYCGADMAVYDATYDDYNVFICCNKHCPERETFNMGFFDEQQIEKKLMNIVP